MDISHLRLKTSDLEQTREFYVGLLDFALIDETPESIMLDAGSTILSFEEDEDFESPYHFAFNIPHNQFADAKAWLASRVELLEVNDSATIEWPNWNARALYFRDMDGNVVELIARFGLDNESDIPFSAQSILRISEIGLGTDDVARTSARLQEMLGQPVWDVGSENFVALGDEEGLIIIVKRGRPWFPTSDALAKDIPFVLTLRDAIGANVEDSRHAYVIKSLAM